MAVDVSLLNSNSKANIETNFQRIENALQDVVGRSGTVPNEMNVDLDMNGNDLLNIRILDVDELSIGGDPVFVNNLTNFPDNSVTTPKIVDKNVTIEKLEDEIVDSLIPAGGATNQVLTKNSGSDYDATWKDITVDPVSAYSIVHVTSVAGLKGIDTTLYSVAYLSQSLREGYWKVVDLSSITGSTLTAYTADTQNGIFALSTFNAAKVWRRVMPQKSLNVAWFDVPGDLSITKVQTYDRLNVAWNVALAMGYDIYHPTGVYDCGESNFPYRQKTTPVALLDCGGIAIYGDGYTSILQTTSVFGADVINLWGIDNLVIRDVWIRSYHTGVQIANNSYAGSNGISLIAGWDRIEVLDVKIGPLAYIDKSGFNGSLDGGKALTFQSEAATLKCGRLRARYTAKNCVQGFGYESNVTNMATKTPSVDIDLQAENCYVAVLHGAAASSGATNPNNYSGVRVKAHAVNCQIGLWLARTHGIEVDLIITSNLAQSTKATSHTGAYWNAADLGSRAVQIAYAKDSNIRVSGDAGFVNYTIMLGSATPGASAVGGATENCTLDFRNLRGFAAITGILDITTGGTPPLVKSWMYLSAPWFIPASVPDSFKSVAIPNSNLIYVGTEYAG